MNASTIQAPQLEINPKTQIKQEDISKQLDLVPTMLSAPIYRLRRINQVQGTASLALTTNSTTLSQFSLAGSRVYNFAKSFLQFDVTFAAGAANVLTNILTDSIPIDSIRLFTDSGAELVKLANVQAYTKVIQHLTTPMDEFLSRSPVYADTALGNAQPISINFGCQSAWQYTPGAITATTAIAAADLTAPLMTFAVAPVNNGVLSLAPDGGATVNSNVVVVNGSTFRTTAQLSPVLPSDAEIIDVAAGTQVAAVPSAYPATQSSGTDTYGRVTQRLASSAPATATQIRFRIGLKALVGTMLAMNKDVYFGENLTLEINWAPLSRWGFTDVVACGNAGAAPALTRVTNYFLYAAEDINNAVTEPLKHARKNGGIQMLIPFTTASQTTTPGAAGAASISTNIPPGAGLKLKRVLTVPVSALNSLKLSANTFNVAGVKWTDIQSFLDTSPLQDWKLMVANSDPYNYMYELCKNSPAFASPRTFESNSFFLDNFSDCDDCLKFADNDCKLSGYDVANPTNYTVQLTQASTGGLILYQYQTWVRSLVISDSGTSFSRA